LEWWVIKSTDNGVTWVDCTIPWMDESAVRFHFADDDNAYAVVQGNYPGGGGCFWKWNGTAWVVVTDAIPAGNLNSISSNGPSDIYVLYGADWGAGVTIYHYTGSGVASSQPLIESNFGSVPQVCCVDTDNVYIVDNPFSVAQNNLFTCGKVNLVVHLCFGINEH